MPAIEVDGLLQNAVLWEATGSDDYGQPRIGAASVTYDDPDYTYDADVSYDGGFVAPVEIPVRWNTRRNRALDPQGNTILLDASAVVEREIPVGSIVWLGELAEWSGTGSGDVETELMEVKTYRETPDVRNGEVRRVIGMMKYKGVLPTIGWSTYDGAS